MKLKAAIIGYGYWGPKLARNFLNSSKFQINYVVDNKTNNLIKAKNEIPLAIGLNNLDEIKAQNLDLIILSTPTMTHFKLVKKFLKFTNVLVEKPLSLNLKHARELEKIARKSKNLLFVDYPFIFSGSTNYIKKIIKNN